MSFPRYPAYKASGVEWLGEVPAHWGVHKCGREVSLLSGFAFPSAAFSADSTHHKLLRGVNVGVGSLRWNEVAYWERSPDDGLDRYELNGGELVIGMDRPLISEGMRVAKVATQDLPCLLLQRVVAIRSLGRINLSHFERLLASPFFVAHFSPETTGVSVPHISPEQIQTFVIPNPPPAEQTAIAAFLDRETARIDALVAEQERLIALLKEKRQAVISHAVTKGLNPEAPMKDSGVEWLGEVPAHWEVKPIKHSITKIEQGWSPQCENSPAPDGEWGVLKVGCGNRDRFDPSEQKALPRDIQPETQYEIRSGDILMSRGNTLELVGSATHVRTVRPMLLLCDLLYRFRAQDRRADPEFVALSLRSPHTRFQIERDATGTSSSMKKIGQGVIRELVIPLPPFQEQRAIAAYVEGAAARIDTLTAQAQRAIDLLQERRTALISAAVTGQIEGLYGPKVDADAYLSKFIPISLTLPKKTSLERHGQDDNRKHCESELTRLGFPDTEYNGGFAIMTGILSTLFNLSLRDVERAVMLYSFAQPLRNSSSASAWPIVIKLHKPELHRRLCAHDPRAHKEAAALAALLRATAPDADWLLSFFEAMHHSGATGFKSALPENARETLMSQGHWSSAKHYMTILFSRIDLTVE
jgi:type I restriction enzyme S subunit